jgi:hypothetical protein
VQIHCLTCSDLLGLALAGILSADSVECRTNSLFYLLSICQLLHLFDTLPQKVLLVHETDERHFAFNFEAGRTFLLQWADNLRAAAENGVPAESWPGAASEEVGIPY